MVGTKASLLRNDDATPKNEDALFATIHAVNIPRPSASRVLPLLLLLVLLVNLLAASAFTAMPREQQRHVASTCFLPLLLSPSPLPAETAASPASSTSSSSIRAVAAVK